MIADEAISYFNLFLAHVKNAYCKYKSLLSECVFSMKVFTTSKFSTFERESNCEKKGVTEQPPAVGRGLAVGRAGELVWHTRQALHEQKGDGLRPGRREGGPGHGRGGRTRLRQEVGQLEGGGQGHCHDQ